MRSTFDLKKYLIVFILILILALPINTFAKTKNLVNIYFFHSKDCSHCNSEIKFLDDLEAKYDNIKIYRYEVHDKENNQARLEIIDLYDLKGNGVPLTIIGDTPYLGYIDTSSNLKFIKTIEYYSRYGYQDKVGELLQIEALPTYKIDKTAPTLEEFMKNYGNYQLIGSIYTNDLDISTTATILGLLSRFNLINIITLIIVICITFIKDSQKSLIYILAHLMLSYVLTSIYTISSPIYTLCLSLLIIALSLLCLIYVFKTKHQKYLCILILSITLISSILTNFLYPEHLTIFKELIKLHNLTGLNKITYYGNYLSTALIINIIYIVIAIFLNSSILNQFFFKQKVSK